MNTIPLSDLETLAVGLFALVLATALARRVPLLARLNVPVGSGPALSGGQRDQRAWRARDGRHEGPRLLVCERNHFD